jgi:hypothetical protein
MIKMLVTGAQSGVKMGIIGLTAENIGLLQEGKPIMVELDEIGMGEDADHKQVIAIMYGESHQDLLDEIGRQLKMDMPAMPEPGPGEVIRMTP